MYVGNSGDTWKEGYLGSKGKGPVKKDSREEVLEGAQSVDSSSVS